MSKRSLALVKVPQKRNRSPLEYSGLQRNYVQNNKSHHPRYMLKKSCHQCKTCDRCEQIELGIANLRQTIVNLEAEIDENVDKLKECTILINDYLAGNPIQEPFIGEGFQAVITSLTLNLENLVAALSAALAALNAQTAALAACCDT